MKCKVLHETRGRLRVHLIGCRLSLADADKLEGYLSAVPGVTHAKVYDRTADAVVCYAGSRAAVIGAFARYNKADAALDAYLPAHSTRALNREFEDNLVGVTVRRFASKLFFPAPLRAVLAVIRGIRYVWKGLSALRRGKLTVEVLDATAVSVSLLRGDFKTAASVMFMLKLGEILEEWTRKKSLADLADAMSLHVDKVWRVEDGAEVLVPIGEVAAHDRIAVFEMLLGAAKFPEAVFLQRLRQGGKRRVQQAVHHLPGKRAVVKRAACGDKIGLDALVVAPEDLFECFPV